MALLTNANDHFDVVLMDITMPVMDGLETAMAIRSGDFDPHIPIIALSAHEQNDQLQKPGMAAFDAYVMKPVNFERLFATMSNLVEQTKLTATQRVKPLTGHHQQPSRPKRSVPY